MFLRDPYVNRIFPENDAYSAVAKSLFLASGFAFAFFCGRNFRSEKHLQATYEARATAIGTFDMFINTSKDDRVKEQILLETCRLVFSPAVTGYLGANENVPQTPTSEVIKAVVNAGKGAGT